MRRGNQVSRSSAPSSSTSSCKTGPRSSLSPITDPNTATHDASRALPVRGGTSLSDRYPSRAASHGDSLESSASYSSTPIRRTFAQTATVLTTPFPLDASGMIQSLHKPGSSLPFSGRTSIEPPAPSPSIGTGTKASPRDDNRSYPVSAGVDSVGPATVSVSARTPASGDYRPYPRRDRRRTCASGPARP